MKIGQPPARRTPPANDASAARLPSWRSFETLWDGTAITVRELQPDDFAAVMALADHLSGDELYLRFFTYHPKYLAEWAHSVTEPVSGRLALGAFDGSALLAVGNYIPTAQSGTAEIAIVVAHHNHRRGIATMVLKQLGSHARSAGTQRLVADVLAQNRHIRQVIADAGWPCRQHRNDDVINIEVDLTETSPPDHAATPRTAQLSVASSTR